MVYSIPQKCIQKRSDKRFTLSENKVCVQIENTKEKEVQEIQIDGCVISSSQEQKCDYLLRIDTLKKDIFIELKGKKRNCTKKPIEQIENTIALLDTYSEKESYVITARTTLPRFNSTLQEAKQRFKTQGFGSIDIKENNSKIKI